MIVPLANAWPFCARADGIDVDIAYLFGVASLHIHQKLRPAFITGGHGLLAILKLDRRAAIGGGTGNQNDTDHNRRNNFPHDVSVKVGPLRKILMNGAYTF